MFGPRLPAVLCTIGTYWVIWWFAKRHFNLKTAQLSALILASSLLVVALGRLMMTDTPLLLSFTAAMLTFWESLVGKRQWRIATAG
ncbi:glycosyltransferase family 39 protein, partial [Acinetobacter baumannii]